MIRWSALVLAAGLVLCAPAKAAQVVTWDVPSRFVDLSQFDLGGTPPHLPNPRALRVNVFLPDGYDGKRRFPVLYMLHGHGEGYADWANPRKGNVLETAKGFPAIIVMPEGWRGWYTNWWNGGLRGNPAWERYHLDELIPLVERRLRVLPGRRWHAVAGWSIGGLGALYYASQRPGYFGSAASFSGTISLERPEWPTAFETQGEDYEQVYGDPTAQRFYTTGHNPVALTENLRHTRLYVTTGNGVPAGSDPATDAVAESYVFHQNNDFFLAASMAGLDVTYHPRQGVHNINYWREHFKAAAAWDFFRPVAEAPEQWSYRTVAQSGEMWGLRFEFERPPETVETFTRRGDTLSGRGAGTVSVYTPDACRFTAALPFTRTIPSGCRLVLGGAPRIRLSVAPRRVRAGRVTLLRFRATAARGDRRRPVAGARVRLAGRRARTGPRGLARMAVRLSRRGRFRATASRRGMLPGRAYVRVR